MKMKTLATAILLASSSSLALANSYQGEVGASYSFTDGDDTFGLRGEYHFSPVQIGSNPLAEAAFLNRSSNVFVEGVADLDVLQAGVEYYIPNSMFYVKAAATRVDLGGSTDSSWYGAVGIMPVDGLLITTTFGEDDYDPNLQFKYVTSLGGGNFLNLEADIIDTDIDTYFSLAADFYIDTTFSIGAGYADVGVDAFTLRARKFFSNELSAGLAYTDYDGADETVLDIAFRF